MARIWRGGRCGGGGCGILIGAERLSPSFAGARACLTPRFINGGVVTVALDVLDCQYIVAGVEYVAAVIRHGRSPLAPSCRKTGRFDLD